MKNIILASASPRRQELLKLITEDFIIEPAMGEEQAPTGASPAVIVKSLSNAKAREIRNRHKNENVIIIGADTIVTLDGVVLGKPKDKNDAAQMLSMLSGKTHQVYTGVTVLSPEWEASFAEKTDVVFYPLSHDEIISYVDSGEPMDKAGAYGIQGLGGKFVKEIHGDYNNVVGLPVSRLYQVLKEIS